MAPHASFAPSRWTSAKRPARWAFCGLILSACNQTPVLQVDQVSGESIAFWNSEQVHNIPVFATAPAGADACQLSPGPCASFCTGAAGTCAPDSCRALAIDSLTQLSTFLSPSLGDPAYGPSCAVLRSAPEPQLDASRVQLRIHDLGTLQLPESKQDPERWVLNDGRSLSGVLGGDFLLQFAAEFLFPSEGPPKARFFRRLPGSQRRLEDRGLSYLAAQSPGQFLGRVPGDQCELAPGLPCDRPIAQLGNLETQKVMPPSRLQLDVCVSPPSCALAVQDPNTCVLRDTTMPDQRCRDWRQSEASGASLLLATAVSDLVLFSDSAARIIPEMDNLRECARLVPVPQGDPPNPTFCKLSDTEGSLRLPGWPPLKGLPTYKVASLAVLSGVKSQYSAHPCDRWQQRMQALKEQCVAFRSNSYLSYPTLAINEDPQLVDALAYPTFQAGVLAQDPKATPVTQDWLTITVVPASSALVRNLRRSSGTIAAQADGLLGMSVFRETRLYLDFTERDHSPGLRVQCLEPQKERCRSLPPCATQGDLASPSCCFGLPQELLLGAVKATPLENAPHPCCAALSETARGELNESGSLLCP